LIKPENKLILIEEGKMQISKKYKNVKIGLWMLLEKMLRWCINPRLRARLLRFLGAQIGENVRIYEVNFINLVEGFKNLIVGDDVHIGPGTVLDLTANIIIGSRTTISPGVLILTHSDPGLDHQSKIVTVFPRKIQTTQIGDSVWIGARCVILCGIKIDNCTVIGAGSVVTKDLPSGVLAIGVPARVVRQLNFSESKSSPEGKSLPA
jgi:maltose O-acetyltransferase